MANQYTKTNLYAIGFVRGRSIHYLATRETNFARAKKTLRTMLRGNKRYTAGVVGRVILGKAGYEKDIKTLYERATRASQRRSR